MSVVKVIEILANSEKSYEDAIESAIEKVSTSVKHIRSAFVQSQSVTVEGGKVKEYRVNLKITFRSERLIMIIYLSQILILSMR